MALPYVCRTSVSQLQHRGTQLIYQRYNALHSTSLSLSARLSSCCQGQSHVQLQRHFVPSRILSRNFKARRNTVTEIKQLPLKTLPPSSDSLVKPLLFTVGVCGFSFMGGMILSYEKMRTSFQKIKNGQSSSDEMIKPAKAFGFRQHINGMWNNLTNGDKVIVGIVATNLVVLGLWRVPRLQTSMVRYFSSSLSHPLPSMTLSSFSHISPLHMFINMYVLWSFTPVAVKLYGYEQFSAVYVSGGTVASFASIALNKLLKRPNSISVGASGAIMALLGIVCVSYPDAQLSIALVSSIFPHSFSAESGMKGIIAFDLLGLVLGWRVIDHAGHLGGMMFGILYAKYGHDLIWGNRETIMKLWHDLRGKP